MLCNNLATKIWEFCIKRGVYISAAHIPGKENIIAGLVSREFQDSHEGMLSLEVFKYLVELFQIPDIDIFASRLNKQLPKYASWMPDTESYIIDCMSTSWENTYIYAFPPFRMIWPTINKIEGEAEKALIIVLMCPTQTWFTRALELATTTPIIIESRHLHLPGTNKQHPLCPKLKLNGHMLLQEQTCQQIEFRNKLTKSSLHCSLGTKCK